MICHQSQATEEHSNYDTDKYSFKGTMITAKGEKNIQAYDIL